MLVLFAQPTLAYVQSVPITRDAVQRTTSPHAVFGLFSSDEKASSSLGYNLPTPYKEADYDPAAASAFFRERPLEPLKRFAKLSQLSGGFIAATLLDKALKREDDMVEERSQQLLELVTKLGPTFIKVGQALSIRTDLLPAPYVAGLTQLQDAVPPFSGALGRSIIELELGVRIDETFSHISPEPVASASIGQVYKATLKDAAKTEVAVKVQRPRVLYDVALDLYIMREILVPLWQKANPDANTDLVGLVDAWGRGFVNELDYTREAAATKAFSAAMEERGLASVTAPDVIDDLSAVHVLTTGWVDGERLAASEATDVARLCGVALNAYLTMLLDTGTLHCDPHPGNLLRTTDGKLCILDFGMVLDVPEDLQLSLLEFIANLQAEQYERVPDDLVKLGFVPEDKIGELRASGLTYGIAQMLRVAAAGGGPKGAMERLVEQNKEKYRDDLLREFGTLDSPEAVKERQRRFREDYQKEMARDALARGGGEMPTGGDSNSGGGATSTTADLSAKIEQLQAENSNVFGIPEYFVYMSRAFATLEGIGLSSDANYAILSECFPYLAKRLLSDDSPRARAALETLLYRGGTELDLSKLTAVTDGLQSYTASTASVASSKGEGNEGRNAAASQLASVVLSEESNYVQSLLLREAAVALDASVRGSIAGATSGRAGATDAPKAGRVLPPLPLPPLPRPLAPLLAPITLPYDLLRATAELQSLDETDVKRLDNVKVLTELASASVGPRAGNGNSPAVPATSGNLALGGGGNNGGNGGGIDDLASLARQVRERRAALARIGVRFGGTVAATQAERLRQRQPEVTSPLAGRLASVGAERLEDVARAIATLDENLGAQTGTAGDGSAAAQPPRLGSGGAKP